MKVLTAHAEYGTQPIYLLHLYWMPSPDKKQDYAGAGIIGRFYFLIAAPFRGMKISAGGVILNFFE